ncbi:MAG TPA: anthrone oxygenase family protein [Chitinophagaceae bacterium]|nr:anthrone oxygenase family protein [Chitinophagaceae bacterium]
MTQKSIQLVTGLLLVMVTGLFWGTWFSLSRTMYELPPETFLTIGKRIIKNVALPMSIIMPASIIGLLTLCIMSWKTKSVYFYCIFATLLLFIIALIITVAVEVPIDNQVKTWSAASIPFDWQYIRNRWEHYHTIRTLVSLSGIVFFLVAVMNGKQSPALKF